MENRDFEGSLARLDEIVSLLESGKCTLDESFALFEEGTALSRQCEELLAKAKCRLSAMNDVRGESEQ